MSVDQLIAKLQKLSTQVEKGMSKQGFTVWIEMIRQDLFRISNAEMRKGALKLLGVVECAGFCLDKVPEARESLILPNLAPLIEFLQNGGIKKDANKSKQSEAELQTVAAPQVSVDDGDLGFNAS